jgi:hypothetical protein
LEAQDRVEDAAVAWEKARERNLWSPLVTGFGVETEEVLW